VIRDAVIVETAQAAPTSRASLARLPGFGGRAGQRHVREFAAAVARALALPDAELPALAARGSGPPPARVWPSKYPEAAARLTACRGCVVEIAAGLDLPQENLLEPEVVRRLAWTPPAEPTESSVRAAIGDAGARPWQIGLTAARLAEILRGPA
jgi:ribonuclease D